MGDYGIDSLIIGEQEKAVVSLYRRTKDVYERTKKAMRTEQDLHMTSNAADGTFIINEPNSQSVATDSERLV